ncbi:MAG: hypothetical protein NTY02_15585, partial [Acidobacteria bacterium]|nr:hypothetical protein [Acidobacteriota bacterium]
DLSEQFLISCNRDRWNCGDGGWTAHKYHYDTLGKNQTSVGAVLESVKPYTATDGSCTIALSHPYALSAWQFITPDEFSMPTVDQVKNAIYTYGPVTAGVCVDNGWDRYSGGVYVPTSNQCDGGTDHQIILVGWDDATSSWILRNSWGSGWGERGYMRIQWDTTGAKSRVGEGTSWVRYQGTSSPNPTISDPANQTVAVGRTATFTVTPGGTPAPTVQWQVSPGGGTAWTDLTNSAPHSGVTTPTLTVTNVTAGLNGNRYRARATNSAGTATSNAATLTVGTALPPGAPSGLTASASGSNVSLAWTAPATGGGPTAYVVEAGSAPGFANLANFSTGSAATSYAAGGVGNGTYYVRVRATNSAGTSGPSNEAILVVGGSGCSGPPGAPGGLTITQNSGGHVAFRWSAAAGGPTTYVVEAGSGPGLANLARIDLGGTGSTFAASGVGSGIYFVRVRAGNTCGTSGASNEVALIVQ